MARNGYGNLKITSLKQALAQKISQPNLREDSGTVFRNPNVTMGNLLQDLTLLQEKLGPEYDLETSIVDLKKAVRQAESKQTELNILAFIAFHANDEHIVEIRKQLFLATKMSYDTLIQEFLHEIDISPQSEGCVDTCSEPYDDMNNKHNFHILFDRFHNWIYNFRSYKNLILGNKK